ncbi:NHL domain-containing thioredoxin family protein [Glutamicibacter protophormiae]|uniref:NHL domain-containing thioredoxin family protein n=1 Tax=Glutamicibacter protophormiae TaxID=37930 RepID=UPI002A8337AF|nr:NHL domain-containing thioredoxin family protein [Glutamicibacter protophormiae]WPR63878.1 NHL domain-containing thioredoxin family protein [Glutamicibacter protophormiae]WPR67373.1 NHL domain-containing thioredoxin family protein [Glutamicibacter protophormiae]
MSATSDSVRANYKVRASELLGRNWLNTGGKQLDLEALRGKIVILDFWTFCCINCLHVLDELRPLEAQYADVLVTVGVHSPKFEHEADPEALAAAVERYEIHHPVLDDPELVTWQAYGARAWPTLVVLDPEGYIVAHLSGEGHAQGLGSLIEELIQEHEAKGTLHRGDGPYVAPEAREGDLRFPGKAVALENGNFLVGDSGHHRLVELSADLQLVRTIGAGVKGYADGGADTAQFNELQGLAVLPAQLAAQVGYDVVVADTVNHRLRSVNLATGAVGTLAGNGVQRLLDADTARSAEQPIELGTDALNISLSSPWDVLYHPSGRIIIAMAGTHQIFAFDPRTGAVSVFAGSGLEGLADGAPAEAWFAQPSGLALAGEDVWVADSETSALRRIEIADGQAVAVHTAIGAGLFDFGFRDGAAEQARLQHPLGVAVLPDHSIAIADSYNGAVRRFDPSSNTVSTLAKGLKEPADVLVDTGVDGDPVLLVVETNTHQLVRIPIPAEALVVDEGASQTQRPKTRVQAGDHEIQVRFAAPKGQKLDDRWGDPTQLKISASPEELILHGAGTSTGLTRTLSLNPQIAEGVLHITARAAACDGEPGGEIPDHAACHLYQQDWGIPVLLDAEGENALLLDLRGVN